MLDIPDAQAAAAREQSLFRDVNERVEQHVSTLVPEFLCECASHECIETIPMAVEDYEAIRSVSNRFLVLPGHVVPEVERVVAESERYIVVEKLGAGEPVAVSLDRRRRNTHGDE